MAEINELERLNKQFEDLLEKLPVLPYDELCSIVAMHGLITLDRGRDPKEISVEAWEIADAMTDVKDGEE